MNLNYGFEDLIEDCSSLKEYIFFVERVREYNMEVGIERAVKKSHRQVC